MSSYLQRLVSQAKSPAASTGIHPLVRSLYAPSAIVSNPPVESAQEVTTPIAPSANLPSQPVQPSGFSQSEPHLPVPSGLLMAREGRDPGRGHNEASVVTTDSKTGSQPPEFAARSSAPPAQFVVQDFPGTDVAGSSRESISSADAPVTPSQRFSPATGPLKAEPQSTFQPLMPRQQRAASQPYAQPAAVASAPAGDEIHINIGRIEVTAIPQSQAPRPAPRAQRRSFSLDEYLRKADTQNGRGL